jgi:hypothetical protein
MRGLGLFLGLVRRKKYIDPGPPGSFYLLQEDGASRLTLEDDSGFLILEAAP